MTAEARSVWPFLLIDLEAVGNYTADSLGIGQGEEFVLVCVGHEDGKIVLQLKRIKGGVMGLEP